LEGGEEFESYLRALGTVDFQFHNLAHLRKELAQVLLQVGGGK
jgi:hypothetical protein